MTWPNENSQPKTSRTIPQSNIFGTQAHKPFESKWVGLTTYHSCRKRISPAAAEDCQANTAKRKQPTNNFLHEDSKEPLLKNIRNNQLIQNQFASQFITVFNWARVKAKLTIASLTWPTETSQPTISCSKTRTNETIIGTQANKPVTSKWICLTTDLSCQKSKSRSEAQYCETNLANWKQPTNDFSLKTANDWNHYRK